MAAYAPLWCKSNFSFLEGASHPEELIEQAAHLGLRSLALTDRDGVHGVVRAHLKARELGVQLLIGSEVTLSDGSTLGLLAQNRMGYSSLCRLISAGRLRSPKGQCTVGWQEVCEQSAGLLALWGGERSLLVAEDWDPAVGEMLKEAFGDRLYALLTRHRRAEEGVGEARLRQRAAELELPRVASTEVLYHMPVRRRLQDVLTCIRHGVSLASAGRLIKPNAEHGLRSPESFAALYRDDPAAVERSLEIAGRCDFSLDQLRYRYPSERLPDGSTSSQWLRQLCFAGARERYADRPSGPTANGSADWYAPPGASLDDHDEAIPPAVREQLERELAVIDQLDYPGYFLTMYEIVQFCRSQGILCQGRGSAANSAVCYCLGVTAIDPVRMGLLFERFLSVERAEPPDIDLDISHARREEVIQWVYDKYGRDHAAMVAVVVRYRTRSAVREIGKALGLSETGLDRLAKLHSHYDSVDEQALDASGLDLAEPTRSLFVELVHELLDFPRHLSIHPGGFLLGHEPVHDLVPIENGSMPERTVIQWDKDDVEALGLFKVDLLGLGALTQLDLAFQLLRQHRDVELSMATIPPADPATFEMICAADTVGTFQIESRAQMSMLPRLRPQNFYDLVIEVSIVRPGPITGGMVHPYLRRRRGEEPVDYPHPCLEPVLAKTLGVPIFQEQVMKLAVVAADYSPGEADQLRRDMAAWRKAGRIERHRQLLTERMMAKGIEREFAERVFEQIRGFGEYGFPESHAASFALISYATSYLKCHDPLVFACSLLNAQPMGFYSPATIVEDARRHGVSVRPIDVQSSDWDCTLQARESVPSDTSQRSRETTGAAPARSAAEAATDWDPSSACPQASADGYVVRPQAEEGAGAVPVVPQEPRQPDAANRALAPDDDPFALRMGLRYVKRLGEHHFARIAAARAVGADATLDGLVRVSGLDEGALCALAEAGALECYGLDRRQALWEVRKLVRERGQSLPTTAHDELPAFAALGPLETVGWDYQSSSHSPRGHPLESLREQLDDRGLPDAARVSAMRDGRRVHYAGLVICRQRPGTASGVTFMTLEDESGFVNVVVWRKVYERYRLLVKAEPFLGVTGKLQVEQDVVHLIAEKLWVPRLEDEVPKTRSRDFR